MRYHFENAKNFFEKSLFVDFQIDTFKQFIFDEFDVIALEL